MLPNIDPTTGADLRGRPNVNLVNTLELAYTLIGMNTSVAPFNDPRVREAVNYAINRQQLVQASTAAPACPADRCRRRCATGRSTFSAFPCYTPNPTRARELLAAAGHGSGLAITLNVLPRQDIRDIAQVVQAQLNSAGFRVELKNQELGASSRTGANSNFQAFASTNAGSPDPDDYFYRTFRTAVDQRVQVHQPRARRVARPRAHDGRRGAAPADVQPGAEHPCLPGPDCAPGLRAAVHRAQVQRAGLRGRRQPLAVVPAAGRR